MTFKHILIILLLLISHRVFANNDGERVLTIRKITHDFLLQLGDSTTRVLPVEKVDKKYLVQIDGEFSFLPDMLVGSVYKVLEETGDSTEYLIEAADCVSGDIVHSFKASLSFQSEDQPCLERGLPKECYKFYFTPKEEEQRMDATEDDENSFLMMYIGGTVILFLVVFLVLRRKNVKTQDPNLIDIGLFQFDQKGMKLMMKAQSIELSSKESDLLTLLYKNENQTLEREHILKVVWGDDGDYVGRTLDVFISKLRKKLEADPSVKIVNIRGVGYRFVIN
ncbi:MAG: winged helix-turn-helix domain-containing protein [Crocinitomicaceae bacterium]|nr:winged helix-turn-helix domain-containing protein [Crocinitomicaceae bacterium]